MVKLKTLKDLEKEHEKYTYEDSLVTSDELKEEAIKWVKDLRKEDNEWSWNIVDCGGETLAVWIKYFFNLSEEDLK